MSFFTRFSFFSIAILLAVTSFAQIPAPGGMPQQQLPPGMNQQMPPQQMPPGMPQQQMPPQQMPPGMPQQQMPQAGQRPQQVPPSGTPAPSSPTAARPGLPPAQRPNMPPTGPQAGDSDIPVFQNPEGYHYDPTGRRDPFKPYGESQAVQPTDVVGNPEVPAAPPEPLQTFDVSQFKLLGIIWQVRDPKAMIKDPQGRTHIIRKQTKIGRNNGFVAVIREGEVIIVEPSVGDNGVQTAVTRTLTLK